MKGKQSERLEVLTKAGMPVEALSETLQQQLETLDDDELKILATIKEKLNTRLPKHLADPVGVIVW